jgi:phage shock protein E
MGFFDFFRTSDINEGIKQFESTPSAVLLDVRTEQEYSEGHIPGSKNIPLQSINNVFSAVKNKSTPVFVHCLSGSRSVQAAAILSRMGYTNVKNIGGIAAYRGKVER